MPDKLRSLFHVCLHFLSGTEDKTSGQHVRPIWRKLWVWLQAAGLTEVQLCCIGLHLSSSTIVNPVSCAAGEGPPSSGRGAFIPPSSASAAPFVPQSLRQHQQQPASTSQAAPQSSHQQHQQQSASASEAAPQSSHQQHQWQPVPHFTSDVPRSARQHQQQPAAQAAPFVPQSGRQQQHRPDLQAAPAAPQPSRPQLEQQHPPVVGRDPAQAPHHQQQSPAHLQAAAPAQQLPLPPYQGQALAGQPMGQSMGMAGQHMVGQYVAGQSLPTAGQSVAQAMAQSMAQSMGMTVEGMLAHNLAYQDQLRRQQLGARATAERALKDLQERRQQGLQQGSPQGGASQGMDGQGVQQVGALAPRCIGMWEMVQQKPPGRSGGVRYALLLRLAQRLRSGRQALHLFPTEVSQPMSLRTTDRGWQTMTVSPGRVFLQ